MKHIIIISLMLLALSLGFAHPAGKVSAAYDAKTNILSVDFNHKVNNAADHYIQTVIVSLGGKEVIRQTITQQENAEGGSLVYKPSSQKGDMISIQTECNKGGKKSTTITIP